MEPSSIGEDTGTVTVPVASEEGNCIQITSEQIFVCKTPILAEACLAEDIPVLQYSSGDTPTVYNEDVNNASVFAVVAESDVMAHSNVSANDHDDRTNVPCESTPRYELIQASEECRNITLYHPNALKIAATPRLIDDDEVDDWNRHVDTLTEKHTGMNQSIVSITTSEREVKIARRNVTAISANNSFRSNKFLGLNVQSSSSQAAKRKMIARARWVKAIWWATAEAQRLRKQRRATLLRLEALQTAIRALALVKKSERDAEAPPGPTSLEHARPENISRKILRRASQGISTLSIVRRVSVAMTSFAQVASSAEDQVKQDLSKAPGATRQFSKETAGDELEESRGHAVHQTTLAVLQLLVVVCSLFVLYVMDIFVILTEKVSMSQDITLYSINAACLAIFVLDFFYEVKTNISFRGTLYMLLEIFAIATMIPDILALAILCQKGYESKKMPGHEVTYTFRLWQWCAHAARVGTSASIAAKSFHLARLLVKGIHRRTWGTSNAVHNATSDSDSLKVASLGNDKMNDSFNSRKEEEGADQPFEDKHLGKRSIGHGLDHQVSIHFVCMVGFLLFLALGLEKLNATDRTVKFRRDLTLLASASQSCNKYTCFDSILNTYLESMEENKEPVLYLQLLDKVVYGNSSAKDSYREFPYPEVIVAALSNYSENAGAEMHILNRQSVVTQCWSSIILTSVVALLMTIVTSSLSNMIRINVVIPLQHLVRTVLILQEDPLKPLQRRDPNNSAKRAPEVVLIENTLMKFAALLQVGLGEAGANIIRENIQQESVGINSNVPGRVVNALYGFCDIRNFTDCTEALQVEVVKLVNEVANLVHNAVVDNFGAPNKNIGDAFLLVWKPKGSNTITEVAESALRSYIRTIIEITQCKKLSRWANKPEIQIRSPGPRFIMHFGFTIVCVTEFKPIGFQVRMGFGLHCGWSIEGAIGSSHKIDASYLSPHVNMASRLEAATKQYGVSILISEDVYSLLSISVQDLCRFVDRVTMKGSTKPMKLYTYDVPTTSQWGGTLDDDVDVSSPSIALRRFFSEVAPPRYSSNFRSLWGSAMDLYSGGPTGEDSDWCTARSIIGDLLAAHPEDGLALKLLGIMQGLQQPDGAAPAEWPGYRHLDEK